MTPEQLDEIEQRADCAYGTQKLPIEVLRDLYPLLAEVRRLRAQVEAVKQHHRPVNPRYNERTGELISQECAGCDWHCYGADEYPCPTIQALGDES